MSIQLAALDALLAMTTYRTLYVNCGDLSQCHSEIIDANMRLRLAFERIVGGDLIGPNFDAVSVLEVFAKSLAHKPETAALAGDLVRAIGQHRAALLVPKLLSEDCLS